MPLYNPELRPTKVDRPSDVVNLVDTGDLVGILSKDDATKVMESIYRLSDEKMVHVENLVNRDADIDKAVRCGYLKAAHIADRFGGVPIDPLADPEIVAADGSGIFTNAEFTGGNRSAGEFRKTASIMKLVMNGFAGAGTVEMGGYDYHGGRRAEGEVKDFRAGQCMGACLEYAARLDMPLMLYVFSDGSLSSNGAIDDTQDGRGKGEWTSDNSSTAGSFFLVYNPPRLGGRPLLRGATPEEQLQRQQLGYMDAGGSVARAECLAVGADDFMEKPADPKGLRSSVNRLLRHAQARRDEDQQRRGPTVEAERVAKLAVLRVDVLALAHLQVDLGLVALADARVE